jgi:hypothetical protein
MVGKSGPASSSLTLWASRESPADLTPDWGEVPGSRVAL